MEFVLKERGGQKMSIKDRIMRLFGYENIKNIKISEEFKKTPPQLWKVGRAEILFLKYCKFRSWIVIDKNGILEDGYITYLIAKKYGKKYVKVIRTKT